MALALVAACSSDSSTSSSTTAAKKRAEDFVATPATFTNLHKMTPVRGFYITNAAGHLDETLKIARADKGGTYPVGTIIQLWPGEAMVKRRAGFDPKSGDWEFFELDTSATGTVIHKRGGAEVTNRFGGGSCANCHNRAQPKYDLVCEEDHGCPPLPFDHAFFKKLQDSDPRPM